jgi:hypothetical protein
MRTFGQPNTGFSENEWKTARRSTTLLTVARQHMTRHDRS